MRLTPADVHNVAFKKPSIGKRGYDEDEVDAFLDLVEAELSRLIEENNELTQRLASASADGSGGLPEQSAQDQLITAEQHVDRAPAEAPHQDQASAAVSVQKAPPAVPVAEVQAVSAAPAHVQAARLLGLAQETAERLTSEASAEADSTKAAAKAESDRLLSEAQAEANRLLSEAQDRSETMVNDATAQSETLEKESRVRADALDREAQSKYAQVMGQLTEQRTTLERKIDDLRVYEREYRSRLKSWITDQLTQLEDGGASGAKNDQRVQQGAE